MDYINFLAKDDFPMSTDVANQMQEMTLLASKLALLGGNNYILRDCKEDTEGNVSNGLIVMLPDDKYCKMLEDKILK